MKAVRTTELYSRYVDAIEGAKKMLIGAKCPGEQNQNDEHWKATSEHTRWPNAVPPSNMVKTWGGK